MDSLSTKKKIGYLPEANPLYYDMYVREYLQFIAGLHEIKNANESIKSAIETVGLIIEANKKIGQLSKGYKQRVGLAAALIHDPEVLILDEPTSGLDPNQIAEIREVIINLGKKKTILFSSHILQEVEAMCDRVIIINKGKIVADDRLENLQSANQQQSLIVEFKEKIEENLLHQLNGVKGIEQLSATSFRVSAANPDNVRKQLLELSLKNNLNIVSVPNNTFGLEELFKELTTNNSIIK
jgi:ABC-2 type transport system ATP-binding protein